MTQTLFDESLDMKIGRSAKHVKVIFYSYFLFYLSFYQVHLKTTARDHKLNLLITLKTYQTGTILKFSKRNVIFNIAGDTSGTIYDETHKEHIFNTNSTVEVVNLKFGRKSLSFILLGHCKDKTGGT